MFEAGKNATMIDFYKERIELKDELRALQTKYDRLEMRYERMRQCFDMVKNRYDEQKAKLEEMRASWKYDDDFENVIKVKNEEDDLPLGLSPYKKKLIKEIRAFLKSTSFKQFYDAIASLVVGQDGVSLLLMSIYRYLCGVAKDGVPRKTNALVTAPSGSGKTETLRALRHYFAQKIPLLRIYHDDCSSFTSAGFKGREVDSIYSNLIGCEGIAICWLSEFDKMIRPRHSSAGENVSLDVQSELLSGLEGMKFKIPKSEEIIDTKGIMFIMDGSFNDIRVSREQVTHKSSLGFISCNAETNYGEYDEITRSDILEYGCSAELLGRIPLIIQYRKLSYESVIAVIEKCRSRVSESLGVSVCLTDEYINCLVEKANGELGCRLLEAEIYNAALVALRDSFFQGTGDNIEIILHSNNYEINEVGCEEVNERDGKENE